MKKLKPVVFVQGERSFYRQNLYSQNLLIKAMSEGTTDPKELMRAARLKSVAEVYRTLDKLAIRKEYHDALARNGVDLDFIVEGIKNVTQTTSKDSVKLKGYEMLLKSLGLDKYEKDEESGKSWEELIMEASEKKEKESRENVKIGVEEKAIIAEADYEVNVPPTPEEDRKRQEDEKEVAQQLYAEN